jgi:DNA invertase Pin-like site-specific DNA recombinase
MEVRGRTVSKFLTFARTNLPSHGDGPDQSIFPSSADTFEKPVENDSAFSQWLHSTFFRAVHKSGVLHDPAGILGAGRRGFEMTIYGYARVSTSGQELDIQLAQLKAVGCARIFCEKESGAKDDRHELKRLFRAIKRGDVVIVAALDRLTRGGPFKTLSILHDITSRGAAYRSLAEPWADTTHELGEVLAALVGYIARKTREDIIRRTAAGRERARAMGVKFGRKPKLSEADRQRARARLAAGETRGAVALSYHVSCSTISRLGGCRSASKPPPPDITETAG